MDLEQITKRLNDVESTLQILNLHNEYVFHLNTRRWREMADCFSQDATADIHEKRTGKEEIYRLFTEVIANLNTGKGRDAHFAVQPVIEVDGDKAKGHWLMYIFISNEKGGAERWITGRYDCEYARIEGKWKFSYLKYTSHWPD
jgi:hypothetical protein